MGSEVSLLNTCVSGRITQESVLDLLLGTSGIFERKFKINITTSCDGINLSGMGNDAERRPVISLAVGPFKENIFFFEQPDATFSL